jgi:phytoene synthase
MSGIDADELPLAARLALSYAPSRARQANLTLLLLDARLAAILRQRGEPIIAQLKLAWWRDRLGEDAKLWPSGEPLLERLRSWPGALPELVALVDGWERLLDEQLGEQAIEEFAQGRAVGWLALASGERVWATARRWALLDLALHLDAGEEREFVELAARAIPVKAGLPRDVRPLAVLHTLAQRALDRGSNDLLDGPSAGLAALRSGLFGR